MLTSSASWKSTDGDAELGGLERLLEDLVPLGIFDFEEQILALERLHVEGAQGEGAQMDEWPG